MSVKIYLSGPMRGYDQFNFPSFLKHAAWLRGGGAHVQDWEIISPAEQDLLEGFNPLQSMESQNIDLANAFERDFRDILNCDGMVLLPGWTKSKGACAEAALGWYIKKMMWEAHMDDDELEILRFGEPRIQLEKLDVTSDGSGSSRLIDEGVRTDA